MTENPKPRSILLRAVYLNVNASRKEVAPYRWIDRREELFDQLESVQPHFICLQEVVYDEARGLDYMKDIISRFGEGFRIHDIDFPTTRFDKQMNVILVRNDMGVEPAWFDVLGSDMSLGDFGYTDPKMTAFQAVRVQVPAEGGDYNIPLLLSNNSFHMDLCLLPTWENSRRMKAVRALDAFVNRTDICATSSGERIATLIGGDFNKFDALGGEIVHRAIMEECDVVDLLEHAVSLRTGEENSDTFNGFPWDAQFNHLLNRPDGIYGSGIELVGPVTIIDTPRVVIREDSGEMEALNSVSDHCALLVTFRALDSERGGGWRN